MVKRRFDASLKGLVDKAPQRWLDCLCRLVHLPPPGLVTVEESDLSTVSAAADKLLRVHGPSSWMLHLELQASSKHQMMEDVLVYNVLAKAKFNLPVRSVVVLLRREADRPTLTGSVQACCPADYCYLDFRCDFVRLWQQPPEPFLEGGLGLLPLAPLTQTTQADVERVIRRMKERVAMERIRPDEEADMWAATQVLLGLQYSKELADQLTRGVRAMKESSVYQAIIEEGRVEGRAEGARALLVEQGTAWFGRPDASTRAVLRNINDLDILERLGIHMRKAKGWKELLASMPAPTAAKPQRRKKS